MSDKKNLIAAAKTLQAEGFSTEALDAIEDLLKRGRGDELLRELFAMERALVEDDYLAARETMLHLESLAVVAKSSACMLMLHLLPISSGCYGHDVFDGIGLWLHDCDSPELTAYVQAVLRVEKDLNRRQCYERVLSV